MHFYSNYTIDCDPDWSKTKYFATFDEAYHINIWDLDKRVLISSHKEHSKPTNRKNNESTMVYLKNSCVISNTDNKFVRYCIASNTYTVFSVCPMFMNNPITIMKVSPCDENILAAGTRSGLIAIININEKNMMLKLRGHDNRITSLDWMMFNINSNEAETIPKDEIEKSTPRIKVQASTKESRRRGKPQPIIDSSDVFDIYEFDDLAEEFGAAARPTLATIAKEEEHKEIRSIQSNENFDFVEACQHLKEDIVQDAVTSKNADLDDSIAADNSEFQISTNVQQDEIILQDEIISEFTKTPADLSSDDSYVDVGDTTTKSVNDVTLDEIIINNDTSVDTNSNDNLPEWRQRNTEPLYIPCIASASSEPFIWIWNSEDGVALHKIELKRSQKSPANKQQGIY